MNYLIVVASIAFTVGLGYLFWGACEYLFYCLFLDEEYSARDLVIHTLTWPWQWY
ncbi:MAG: hypothetical protein ACYTE8_01010 [Planctomycetota bacterium]